MNKKTMLNAMSGIDEELIDQYFEIGEEAKKKKAQRAKANWKKWGAIAACFVLALSICLVPMLDFSDPSELLDHEFVLALTVHAADGTENSMTLNQSYLNSGTSGENIFGKDVSTFEFYVAPVEQGEEGDIFDKYDLEISYAGKVVDGDDEHIRVTYVVPLEGIYGVGRYCIIGWFEEMEDVTVTLKDKESGELVEKMTVNVSYSEADAAYQMTMTELYAPDTEE